MRKWVIQIYSPTHPLIHSPTHKLIHSTTQQLNNSSTHPLIGRVASLLEVGTGFHPELTGRENVYFNGAILDMTKQEIDNKINSMRL
jgi:ABC-type polysaccharide/polyol phosphate transport system ATPase subunit